MEEVINLNKVLGNHHFTKHNILKMGRIGENHGNNPRPLKVELDSQITKYNIIRNACQLQFSQQYNMLSIQHDLTRKQAGEFRKLKEESKEAEKEDTSGEYKYRVRGPPGRWEIVKLPKN